MNNKFGIRLPWVICAIAVACASWLFFKLIDQSVTLDHQTQYTRIVVEQRNILANLLNATNAGKSESEFRRVLRSIPAEAVFEKGDGELVAEQVSFLFKDGQFVRVDVGGDTP